MLLEEFAIALGWRSTDAIAMLWAYFDDSENQRHFSVAGCVAKCEQWQPFIVEWNAVLEDFGACWFHATDFHAGQGEFADWASEDNRREPFYNSLLDVIEHHQLRHVSYVIPAYARVEPMSDATIRKLGSKMNWNEVLEERTRQVLVDPYCQCLMWCLNEAAAAEQDQSLEEHIRVVLSDQPSKIGLSDVAHRIVRELSPYGHRISKEIIQHAGPREFVPLQAADLLAWETTRDRVERMPRSAYLRLRKRGRFGVGDPPRPMEGWLST